MPNENQSKKHWTRKLQEKWGLQSVMQVILVLIVFSLAGSTAVMLRKTFFGWMGFTADTSFWIKTVAYILFLFPAYQILLLAYGFLLGQFEFFWRKEVRMISAIRNRLSL